VQVGDLILSPSNSIGIVLEVDTSCIGSEEWALILWSSSTPYLTWEELPISLEPGALEIIGESR